MSFDRSDEWMCAKDYKTVCLAPRPEITADMQYRRIVQSMQENENQAIDKAKCGTQSTKMGSV